MSEGLEYLISVCARVPPGIKDLRGYGSYSYLCVSRIATALTSSEVLGLYGLIVALIVNTKIDGNPVCGYYNYTNPF